MNPDELAARSRSMAAENDRAVLAALVNAGDNGLAPGRDLAALVAMPGSTTRLAVGRLVARGLAKRDAGGCGRPSRAAPSRARGLPGCR